MQGLLFIVLSSLLVVLAHSSQNFEFIEIDWEERQTCGQFTSSNRTLFSNPNFPNPDYALGNCEYDIYPESSDICQLKIYFFTFSIVQPSIDGTCDNDVMTITGGKFSPPAICGFNNGQHLYVEFTDELTPVKITVHGNDVDTASPRFFNLEVTQIPCCSPDRAPLGCEQYYQGLSGTIKSFNYPLDPAETYTNEITSQLSNLQYDICIRPEDGVCSITYSPNADTAPYNFFVSGVAGSIEEQLLGTLNVSDSGDICKTDYIIIPDGNFIDAAEKAKGADRFCGAGFPSPVTSSALPFRLVVKTNNEEIIDRGNFGFNLNYNQLYCT